MLVWLLILSLMYPDVDARRRKRRHGPREPLQAYTSQGYKEHKEIPEDTLIHPSKELLNKISGQYEKGKGCFCEVSGKNNFTCYCVSLVRNEKKVSQHHLKSLKTAAEIMPLLDEFYSDSVVKPMSPSAPVTTTPQPATAPAVSATAAASAAAATPTASPAPPVPVQAAVATTVASTPSIVPPATAVTSVPTPAATPTTTTALLPSNPSEKLFSLSYKKDITGATELDGNSCVLSFHHCLCLNRKGNKTTGFSHIDIDSSAVELNKNEAAYKVASAACASLNDNAYTLAFQQKLFSHFPVIYAGALVDETEKIMDKIDRKERHNLIQVLKTAEKNFASEDTKDDIIDIVAELGK